MAIGLSRLFGVRLPLNFASPYKSRNIAQKAGLQLGDVILSIDGEPASDGRRSMNQVARIKPSDKVASVTEPQSPASHGSPGRAR